MKRLGIFTLIVAMLFSLCACRRKEETKPTETKPVATETAPTVIPEMDPTIGTNIPDPTVDSNSTNQDGIMDENNPNNDKDNGVDSSAPGANGNTQNSSTNENAKKSRMFRTR